MSPRDDEEDREGRALSLAPPRRPLINGHTRSDVVVRKAGAPALAPRVLRRSCITRLIERGVPVPGDQRFAGHADVPTTMRYCSLADDVYVGVV